MKDRFFEKKCNDEIEVYKEKELSNIWERVLNSDIVYKKTKCITTENLKNKYKNEDVFETKTYSIRIKGHFELKKWDLINSKVFGKIRVLKIESVYNKKWSIEFTFGLCNQE